ncbi:NADH:flavin oxidoreductase/NADH oxidase family protein [Aspergillus indologenus CBS 114.80]|uniref:NADH:flavin oxidoreductase/NADH oxidase family protein n=1 Tax=Aspergillus indologenus CBS 114.80 TaxID=1450541 RepID=A0A2V5IGV8_9EURO|nr:NADH:flavin oxidoreductase/NADH oxidase family protein [Aspergillus indologenus CBS 114.80]
MTPYKLFEPLQIGNLHLEHRVVMAPLTRLRADAEHVPLAIAKTYYEQRASVPGTLLIAEATQISAPEGGIPHGPGIWSEPQIQRWKEITDAVHAKGSFIYCQLIALGRAADPAVLRADGGYELHAPSAIPMDPGMPVPKELSDEEILNIINDFARAAKNAIRAGFDGVEIHGANGYLVDQFLQDVSNQRVDRWGGSVSNRALFGLEVARAAVDAIGADRVGFRLSPWNTWQSMKMADPVPQFAYFVEQLRQLNLAYLHLIESRVINNVDCEQGESNKFLLDIWGKTSPVLVAGGYTPENAEAALQDDYKDYTVAIVFGRHFLANPDLPFRIRQGLDLNPYHRESFYTPIQERGYIDYPFSAEFAKVNA